MVAPTALVNRFGSMPSDGLKTHLEEAFLANQEMMFAPASLGEDRERFEFYLHTKRLRPHSADEVSRRMHAIIEYDVWDQLPQLNIPTLVITGADDNLVPPQNSERLAERIRGARLEILPDAGHIFWIEQPEATNRALSEHFERVA